MSKEEWRVKMAFAAFFSITDIQALPGETFRCLTIFSLFGLFFGGDKPRRYKHSLSEKVVVWFIPTRNLAGSVIIVAGKSFGLN